VNTATVADQTWIARALGGEVAFFGALLTSDDEVADQRLRQRELGGGFEWHAGRSRLAAPWLESRAPQWVARVDTNGRTVADVAEQVADLTGWKRSGDALS
jgi:hypothetical protein